MELGFREKFDWLTIVGMLALYGYYFSRVLPPEGPDLTSGNIAIFMTVMLAMIVVFIVGAATLAISMRRESLQDDERDKLINLLCTRNSHYVVASGAIISMAIALITQGNFWFIQAMLATLVLGQLMESASRLYYYRRGF